MNLKKNRIFRSIFLEKLPRKREASFLSKYSSEKETLDIGAKNRSNKIYFPNLKTLNFNSGDEVDIVGDAEDLKDLVKDNSFEVVLCLSVLEHTDDPKKVVNEIKRILKKEGLAVIAVPFIMPVHDAPRDFWRFTKYGLINLFKDFEIVEVKDMTNSLESIGYLYHRLFFQKEFLGVKIPNPFLITLSKINYLLAKLFKSKEYGHFITHKNRVLEENILSSGILGVFRKK